LLYCFQGKFKQGKRKKVKTKKSSCRNRSRTKTNCLWVSYKYKVQNHKFVYWTE